MRYALRIITVHACLFRFAGSPYDISMLIRDRDADTTTLNNTSDERLWMETPRRKLRYCKFPQSHSPDTPSSIIGAAAAIGVWGGGCPPPLSLPSLPPRLVGSFTHTHSHMLVGTCRTAQRSFSCRVVSFSLQLSRCL